MKKKWFIVILVLVIVAVVLTIVFINLFKERDTKALSSKLLQVTQTGYLSREIPDENKKASDENAVIHESLEEFERIGTKEFSSAEVNIFSNYVDALSAYEIAVEFFSREMIFADASATYTNNHVKVQNWLSDAQKDANSLKKYVDDVKLKTDGSDYWTAQTWTDCQKWLNNIIKKTGNAVAKLTEIYRDSVPMNVAHKGFMNNGFTDIVFDAMKEQIDDILTKSAEKADFGDDLYVLVKAYLVKESEDLILNFPYENISPDGELNTLADKVADIKINGKTSKFYDDFVSGRWAKA